MIMQAVGNNGVVAREEWSIDDGKHQRGGT
jgi:hypothetical protein